MAALSMPKLANGLLDLKLLLAWILNGLGVPAALVSALVSIREAGAQSPQVFLARALTRDGAASGFLVVRALAALALARASNTAIGRLLPVSGLSGGALPFIGPSVAQIGFAVMAAVGAGVAPGLREADRGGRKEAFGAVRLGAGSGLQKNGSDGNGLIPGFGSTLELDESPFSDWVGPKRY